MNKLNNSNYYDLKFFPVLKLYMAAILNSLTETDM